MPKYGMVFGQKSAGKVTVRSHISGYNTLINRSTSDISTQTDKIKHIIYPTVDWIDDYWKI